MSPDYVHVSTGRSALTVVFSAFRAPGGHPDAYTLRAEFERTGIDSDFLFVRDSSNCWYVGAIKGLASGIPQIAESLRQICTGYRRVIFAGGSMGGYAALLYSRFVECSEVYAFQPQAFLRPGWPRHSMKRHAGRSFPELAETPRRTSRPPVTTVIIGGNEPFDVYQACGLAEVDLTRVLVIPQAFHNVLLFTHRSDALVSALAVLFNAPLDAASAFDAVELAEFSESLLQQPLACLAVDLDRLFRQIYPTLGDPSIVASMAARYPGWDGMNRLHLLQRLGSGGLDLADAVSALDALVGRSPYIDDVYVPLSLAKARLGRFEEALETLELGVSYNASNRSGYRMLAEFATATGNPQFEARVAEAASPAAS